MGGSSSGLTLGSGKDRNIEGKRSAESSNTKQYSWVDGVSFTLGLTSSEIYAADQGVRATATFPHGTKAKNAITGCSNCQGEEASAISSFSTQRK